MSSNDTETNDHRSLRRSDGKALWFILVLLVLLSIAASVVYVLPYLNQKPEAPVVQVIHVPSGVSCLGHIEPEDGTVRLGARSLSGQPSIVSSLLVKEGDTIRAGQVIAILNSNQQLEATMRQAEANVRVAE